MKRFGSLPVFLIPSLLSRNFCKVTVVRKRILLTLLNINAELSGNAGWKRLQLSAWRSSSRRTADWPAAPRRSASLWSICRRVSPRGDGLRGRARDKAEEKTDGGRG